MDHNNVDIGVKQEENNADQGFDPYIVENGKRYRVPYRIIKQVTFTNIDKQELIDIPHSGRLQYRLMLMDPVIKARVDFVKSKITIIYNPRGSNNTKEKISLEELKEFLSKQGIHVKEEYTLTEDYDYYKSLYSYAYNPPTIRERPPYGYSAEQWKAMKPEWEKKMADGEREKLEKYKEFQESYLEENPEIAQKIVEGYKPRASAAAGSVFGKLFGKRSKKDKGFWFHGV